MGAFIELSPFFLGGIGVLSLIIATVARVISPEKRQSKIHKIFTIAGFTALFAAAGIAAWTIFSSIG
jgi:hypothetical protein